MEPPNDDSSLRTSETATCFRGIYNQSKVSCHIACALQILCHAIPTIRLALRRIIAIEEDTTIGNSIASTSNSILLEELLDFVGIHHLEDDSNPRTTPGAWNPQRLYTHLSQQRTTSGLALDPNNVGDATRSLACLLGLLSDANMPSGPAWKKLLDASVWEGETRQILEGRRQLPSDSGAGDDDPSTLDSNRIIERRYLQRIKPATKNKVMPCPLTLKFQHSDDATPHKSKNCNRQGETKWSVTKALSESVEPKVMQGTVYPWETLSPDTYSEHKLIRHEYQDDEEDCDNDESDSCRDDSSSSDSSSGSSCDESSSVESTIDWITYRHTEICCIPRVWLLHMERPRVSINQLQRLSTQKTSLAIDEQESFSLFDHVYVPLELETSWIVTKRKGVGSSDGIADGSQGGKGNDKLCSPKILFLRGAILQVLEFDDTDGDENDEEWEGNHSVTLLRNPAGSDPESWFLIDDDNCQPIPENRALRMMGGVIESASYYRDAYENDDDGGEKTSWKYFSASLLVYSVPDDETKEEWKVHQDGVVSSWKEHLVQMTATAKPEESLVGKRLRIKWSKGKSYEGSVTRYDASTGKHLVTYDDGDVKEYILAKKTVEWID